MSITAESLRFFVIGCGSIGRRHIGNLKTLKAGEIIAYDTRADRLKKAGEEWNVGTVETLEEGWRRSPQVALIAAPTSLHMSLALEAARRGCHLFIEKPLSDRRDPSLQDLLNLVREKKIITLVGCNMRFHPVLLKVKHLLEAETIGRVTSARIEVGQYLPDWHPWEDYRKGYSARKDLGGGVILDAIHEIDYMRWLLGEVESVACFAGKLSHLEIDTEDTAALLIKFSNGTLGELHLDYVQRVISRTGHLIGDQGTIRWDCVAGEVQWYSASSKKWETFENQRNWELNQIYIDEMLHFLRCLNGQERAILDIFEAARVLEIALLAKDSALKKQFLPLETTA